MKWNKIERIKNEKNMCENTLKKKLNKKINRWKKKEKEKY